MNWRRKDDGIEVLRLCYVVSLESTLECWDLGHWRMSGMLDIPWFRKEGSRLLRVWSEVTHVKGVQRAKRKKYHMAITIYPDEYEAEGFELFIGLAVRHEILEFPSHVGCAMSSQDKMPFQDRWRADQSEA